MRKSCISLLFMLFAVAGWAQESKTSDEKTIAPVVVEGNVERVPDGTVIVLYTFTSKISSPIGPHAQDTIKNGKFRIVLPLEKKYENFFLWTPNARHGLFVYASPGTTTTITGVGVDYENWYVKNDNPIQKEANEYRAYLDEKIPGYYDLRRRKDWIDEDDAEYDLVKRKWKEADSLFVERMTEFMQDREYSPVFDKYILDISSRIRVSRNNAQREKAAKLLSKIPKVENRWDNEYLYEARRGLMPKCEAIKIGEKLHDFVLYDHQDKEHHLTEFNDNGKYLLLEFNSRTCVPCMEHRQNETLNALYKNHSDKVDMLMVNCDARYFWDIECKDPNKYGRDPWHEWNDKKDAEDIIQRYGLVEGPWYYFVSQDGTILGKIRDTENLQEAIDKYFKL